MSLCRFAPYVRVGTLATHMSLPNTIRFSSQVYSVLPAPLLTKKWWGASLLRPLHVSVPSAYSTDSWSIQAVDEIEEIDFDPTLANNVSLIGTVGRDVELRTFQTGKVGAVSLAVTNKKGEAEWFNVDLYGPLADRAAENIRKGSRILVEGRLKVSSWNDKNTGAKRTAVKIVASSVKKIKRFSPNEQYDESFQQQSWQQQQQQQRAAEPHQQGQWGSSGGGSSNAAPASQPQQQASQEELWMHLFQMPTAWIDHRMEKADGQRSPKFPDFKKRDGSASLWVDSRGTPAWVKSELPMWGQ